MAATRVRHGFQYTTQKRTLHKIFLPFVCKGNQVLFKVSPRSIFLAIKEKFRDNSRACFYSTTAAVKVRAQSALPVFASRIILNPLGNTAINSSSVDGFTP